MLEGKIRYIRDLIYEDTGLYVVDTDNNHKKPKYPFYSYKITSFILDNNQSGAIHLEDKEEDIRQSLTLDSKFIISFNAFSDNVAEAYSKALKAWEIFKFRGRDELSKNNIVVVSTSDIQDRTIYIVDKYEYRYGFDIELRLIHKIERELEEIKTHTIEGEIK